MTVMSHGNGKNQKLIDARLRRTTADGTPWTPQDVADAMNAFLWAQYQEESLRPKRSRTPTTLDHRFVSGYESGRHRWPTAHYRAAFRHALRVEIDAELGFTPTRRPRPKPSAQFPDKTAATPNDVAGPLHRPMAQGASSRTPVHDTGAAAGAFASEIRDISPYALEWAQRVRHGVADPARFADVSVVDLFRIQLETAKAVDGQSGAAAALSTARGVVDVVESMIPVVPEIVRRELSRLGAEAAEFVGWLYRDLADEAQASRWYDRAMEYAQLCGHLPMQGFVLLRKSQLAYESGDGHRVRMLADAAIEGPWRLPPAVLAEALLQITRGKAMIGHDVDVDTATRQARDVADGEDLTLREASCWIEAGQPERAAQIYGERLGANGLSTRDTGYYRARQAIALAQAEQPDLAAAKALDALSTSVHTGSMRTYGTVRKAHRILAPWHARDTVAALGEAINAAALPSRQQPR